MDQVLRDVHTVVWHGGCNDGYTAMLIVKQRMRELKLDTESRQWIAQKHGEFKDGKDALPFRVSGPELVLDYAYPEPIMQAIQAVAECTVIDHHKTNQWLTGPAWRGRCIMRMDQSGAGLTWRAVYPDTPVPRFVAHIEDRDLFINRLPDTEALTTYLFTRQQDEELYTRLMTDEAALDAAIAQGRAMLEMKEHQVAGAARSMRVKIWGDMFYGIVNCREWGSDVCNRMLRDNPGLSFAVAFTVGGITRFSVRARAGGADISELCERYGGGGHAAASGMSVDVPVDQLPDSSDGYRLWQLMRSGTVEAGPDGSVLSINHNPLWGPQRPEILRMARRFCGADRVELWHMDADGRVVTK